MTGENERFKPDSPVTRAEMAVMLQRFLQLPAEPDAPRFADVTPHWEWARPAIDALSSAGLLTGFPDGGFVPAATATRAQAAALLYRLYK